MKLSLRSLLCFVPVCAVVLGGSAGDARAEPPLTAPEMEAKAKAYYDTEFRTSFSFIAYGAVTAGVGGVSLTQSGDFAHAFGFTSLAAGGLTAVAGAGYGLAVKFRGAYFTNLAHTNPAQYKLEEADRIAGTNSRFWLYLGSEIFETLAGVGIATYGLAAKSETWKGIGMGVALQGIGLFVIDMPGSGRAARYEEDIERFHPEVGFSVGGGDRPWGATLGQKF